MDGRQYVYVLEGETEEEAVREIRGDLYGTTRKIGWKYNQSSGLVTNRNGKVLTNIKDQMNRLAEYVEDHLHKK